MYNHFDITILYTVSGNGWMDFETTCIWNCSSIIDTA
jgi:hypothetical protein